MENDFLKFAVIGDPIKHSLSPVMQNAGIQALGINGDYSAIHVKNAELASFAKTARDELRGFNITVPHKNAIIPYLDELSEECRQTESVNTVLNDNGHLKGFSTDGYGLSTAIKEEFDVSIRGNTFCFIGCGGAVQAVAPYFAGLGSTGLFFINRTVVKAEKLMANIAKFHPNTEMSCCSPSETDMISTFLESSAVIIQGTSLGLNPEDPPPIDPELLKPETCLYETIYKPTPLLRYARENNIKTADGRSMLLHQGVKSLALWTGLEPDVDVMRKALYEAINDRQ